MKKYTSRTAKELIDDGWLKDAVVLVELAKNKDGIWSVLVHSLCGLFKDPKDQNIFNNFREGFDYDAFSFLQFLQVNYPEKYKPKKGVIFNEGTFLNIFGITDDGHISSNNIIKSEYCDLSNYDSDKNKKDRENFIKHLDECKNCKEYYVLYMNTENKSAEEILGDDS